MFDFWGLELSVGLIDNTIQPLEDVLVEELHQAAIVHVDETSWKERAQHLWLWAFVSTKIVYMVIGSRAGEMFTNVLEQSFAGILMTDGYCVARANRLRCWAHLMRKAKRLSESTYRDVKRHGQTFLEHLQTLQSAIYVARNDTTLPAPEPPCVTHAKTIEALKLLCHPLAKHPNDALRAFARELLNDWDVIMGQLHDVHLPNNAAERALRHHVITRRISYGTRSEQGTRGYALLASVMETYRLRKASIIDMLAATIDAARKGLATPPLPAVPGGMVAGV